MLNLGYLQVYDSQYYILICFTFFFLFICIKNFFYAEKQGFSPNDALTLHAMLLGLFSLAVFCSHQSK